MATRMQQRRGTAAQWTAANPVLAAGEIGFETDTSKFKMGNGSSTWSALQYFANASELAALVNGAPGLLDTLDELAQAIGDDPQFYLTIGQTVTNHTNASTMVHGIADTSVLATQSDVNDAATSAASDLSGHSSATTTVHGIADTSLLATQSDVNDAATAAASDLSDHTSATTAVHGIADTSVLATQSDVNDAETAAASALAGHAADTTDVHGIADTTLLVTQSDLTDHAAETANVHGIADTTALVTQSDLTDAITGATVDQSALAGTGIDWNALTEQFDIDSTVATKTYADGAVSTHNSDETNVHGIANTADLATKSYADTAEADAITAAGTAADTKIATAVAALTKSSVGLGNVDNTSDANKPVSTATQTALDLKANLAGPTFTGTVVLPSTTSIGNVSATELGYVDGVTSAIQTQIDSKLSLAGGTMTGALTLSGAPSSDLHAATKAYVDNVTAGLNFHQPVRVATTGNITLSGTQTIDGVAVIAGDRVLVKDQTTQTQNGIYVVASGSWTRATDADNTPDGELKGGDFTLVLEGTVNSGYGYVCSNTSAVTIGTTNITYAAFNAAKAVTAGSGLTESTPGTLDIATGGVTSAMIADGTIVNADINASAAIDQSKISGLSSSLALKANLAAPSFTGGVTVDSSGIIFTDGTQTKEGVPSRTPIIQKTAAYTLSALTERDSLIEVDSASAVTLSIPTDASVNYPVGTTIDILQTNTGQVTIAAATPATTTVNATPGLKLRTRWSSATLLKRAANTWVVYGDLTA
jgi:hypothetical protein